MDQTVREGESACFRCCIVGDPAAHPPLVTWYFNNDVIAHGDIYRMSQHVDPADDDVGVFVLTLPECFPEDAGTYTVKADNGVDVETASAELVVQGLFVVCLFFSYCAHAQIYVCRYLSKGY